MLCEKHDADLGPWAPYHSELLAQSDEHESIMNKTEITHLLSATIPIEQGEALQRPQYKDESPNVPEILRSLA